MEIKLTNGNAIDVREGESLLSAFKRNEIFLIASCGGKGTCGKCKVRLVRGEYEEQAHGKLTHAEREKGFVLACKTFPKGDVTVEIPDASRLVVGDKIAISKSRDLFELMLSMSKGITPLVSRVELQLPRPNVEDHISDIERIRRALSEKGITDMRFSHEFASVLANRLRASGWDIFLAFTEDHEAVFVNLCDVKDAYGIAVDIGTTTVAVYLVDLHDGRIVDVGSTYNSQIRYGDDVITRIVYATEGKGLNTLRDAIVTDINNIVSAILSKHHIERDDVETAIISANTTMSHIFWGLDPGHIREEPYIPTLNSFPLWKAGTARLDINPQGPVYTVPCIASYVGGDIVAGVLASKMNRSEEIALFMDIGTNGEIAVGNSDWLLTAACSAGPCFEGSGIKHGMRATEGAIETVNIDPVTFAPTIGVIGSGKPIGICGSGMIDTISEMFLKGVIDQKGKLRADISPDRILEGEEGREFILYKDADHEVTLTEADIENVLRAKAAIYAGVALLLKEVGLTVDALDRVYVAGGFGNYLNVEKAIILGMIPDMPIEKYSFLGNTSVAGAYLCLLSAELRKEAEDIASKMTYMELSVSRNFMDEYMSALFLPHTDISQFPTVSKLLSER